MRYIIEDDWLVVDHSSMSLTKEEIDLIKVSWRPVLEDPRASGILLFKELFTKFPEYLQLFQKFKDLDVNELENNKRLVAHASKVIDTITAVIDLLGDQDKSEILTEALKAMASSHIRRQIGVEKFKNLGIVLIDFMCQINHRYQGEMQQRHQRLDRQLNDLRGGGKATTTSTTTTTAATTNRPPTYGTYNSMKQDSLGDGGYLTSMDSDNDSSELNSHEHQQQRQQQQPVGQLMNNGDSVGPLREVSPVGELRQKMKGASLEDDEDSLDQDQGVDIDVCQEQNERYGHSDARRRDSDQQAGKMIASNGKNNNNSNDNNNKSPKYTRHNVEPKSLVAVWTKLYGCILETVQAESDRYDKLPKGDSKEEEDTSNASSRYNPSSSSSSLDDDSIHPL